MTTRSTSDNVFTETATGRALVPWVPPVAKRKTVKRKPVARPDAPRNSSCITTPEFYIQIIAAGVMLTLAFLAIFGSKIITPLCAP